MVIHDFKYMLKCYFYYFFKLGYKNFGYRSAILKPLVIRNKKYIDIGNHVIMFEGSRLECYDKYNNKEYSPNLKIGDNVIIGYNFQCLVSSNCKIGKNSLFASNILISTENHGVDPNHTYATQELESKDVTIGENCWIGEKVTILPGVTLGDNVIVGAGSVITKSFESNVIVAGNPARIIKKYNYDNGKWERI